MEAEAGDQTVTVKECSEESTLVEQLQSSALYSFTSTTGEMVSTEGELHKPTLIDKLYSVPSDVKSMSAGKGAAASGDDRKKRVVGKELYKYRRTARVSLLCMNPLG